MSYEFWYMFPVSLVVATTAMSSGIGGATFFSPIFMLILKLPPEIAIGTGLITEVFGFSSGVFAYFKKKYIDYKLAFTLLVATVPLAIVGSYFSAVIPGIYLKLIFGVGLIFIALNMLKTPDNEKVKMLDSAISNENKTKEKLICKITYDNEKILYKPCNKTEGLIISGIGGLFVGMLSTGLGELNNYFLLSRCKVPSKISVGTGVFVIAITVLAASIGHLVKFVQSGNDVLQTVLNIVIFTVPGVIIGGQIGSKITKYIPQRIMEITLSILFFIISVVTILEVVIK